MKEIIKTSDFGFGNSELFVYESTNPNSNRVFLILKGIYGYHVELTDYKTELLGLNWDQAFIRYFQKYAHVVCINTSRLEGFDQSIFAERRNSFEGKTYEQEINDVMVCFNRAKDYLTKKGVNILHIHLLGKSFGGTIFLGLPQLVGQATSITMLGSGCGRSKTTTKPLLSTLYSENILLDTIKKYRGYFSSFRGTLDEIVPIESQEKIVQASGSFITNYIKMNGVDHEFEKIYGSESLVPSKILRESILYHIEFSEKN